MAVIEQPQANEYNPYYHEYIRRVPVGSDVLALLETQLEESLALLRGLNEEQVTLRPAPDEWTIKQIIGHLCDTERIFAYRALRFARRDDTELPGYFQDPYVTNGHFDQRNLADLLDEFAAIRRANLFLFRNFTEEDTLCTGTASGNPISVRALVYICAGHEHHHLESIRTVYLGQG